MLHLYSSDFFISVPQKFGFRNRPSKRKKGMLSIWREHQNYESDISIQSNKTAAPATESAGAIA